ncbi:50S ribosomal protein L29 [Peptoniphilus equinus]|uniref:Large ribosomal subunit protein uL29 n=1 Tax=Peptoniphilus equinus TaxID=3016343 RepID=A0ABY7QS76_9FIRM|nr:50S ribosomal protein L29 [Peptoniphilus equinus]WBW49637.1 50S ribosomal protein L29 [Peptoniphilus equinus]
MKVKELHKESTENLQKRVGELKNELFNLRFRLATGQLENPAQIKMVKKDIARVKTILRQRELEVEKEA